MLAMPKILASPKTRKAFFLQLYFALLGRLSADSLRDVLADYDDFFDQGLQDGLSEADLCEKFGCPRQIARDILAEEKTNSSFFLRSACSVVLLFFFLAIPFVPFVKQISFPIHLLTAALFVPAFVGLWKSNFSPATPLFTKIPVSYGTPVLSIAAGLVGVSTWMFSVYVFCLCWEDFPFSLPVWPILQTAQAGSFLRAVFGMSTVLEIFLLILSLLGGCFFSCCFFRSAVWSGVWFFLMQDLHSYFTSMDLSFAPSLQYFLWTPLLFLIAGGIGHILTYFLIPSSAKES